MPRSSAFPYLSTQTDLHSLWKVHLWVSELPSSRSSSLLPDLGCTALSLQVVVQVTMCHVTLYRGGVQEGTLPKGVSFPRSPDRVWACEATGRILGGFRVSQNRHDQSSMSPSSLHQAAWPDLDYKLHSCLLTSPSHVAATSCLPHGSPTPFQASWSNSHSWLPNFI